MYELYLLTGATGYLGSAVVRQLLSRGAQVRALVLPGDRLAAQVPAGVERVVGSVEYCPCLEAFFAGVGKGACVIHCAGLVSISSRRDDRLWRVNVNGTKNIVAMCERQGVSRLVYVSSVHAIPEKPAGEQICECSRFSPACVEGDYAKTKAAATACVLEAAARGLDACVVHPSGIIGPYDNGQGSVTGAVIAYCSGTLPMGVRGGYDFVDVRDVAAGIVSCCEKGRAGQTYILSGRYVTLREIFDTLSAITGHRRLHLYAPLGLLKAVAPLCERFSRRKRRPLFLTPYSVYTLGSNACFSHEKATRELGYQPRPLPASLSDMVRWLTDAGRLAPPRRRPAHRIPGRQGI